MKNSDKFEPVKEQFQNIVSKNSNVLIILLLVGFGCYYNVIKGPFFFDDEQFIVKNEFVHQMNIKKIYSTSVTQGANIKSNFYRPNQQFIFSILYKVFGENSMAFHINSIFFHSLNAFFLFLLFVQLGLPRNLSLIGAIIFLIHPIHTEAVSYISGFADILGLFFFLSGLLLFLKSIYSEKRMLMLISMFCYLLALFSKESMIVVFPLTLLCSFYYLTSQKKQPGKFIFISWGITGVITTVYLLLKFSVFNFSDNIGLTNQQNIYTEHLYIRIFTFINVLQEYLVMFLFPLKLYYGKPYTAFDTLFTGKACVGIVLIALACYSIIKLKHYPKIALGLGWFFIALLPFSGIVPLNSMFLEHWIYVPFIGLLLLVLFGIKFLDKYKINSLLLFFFFVTSLLFVKRVYSRNEDWANAEKFYLNEIKYNQNVSNYNNLGMIYAEKKDLNKAIHFYQLSVQTYDAFAQPHFNMANIYIEQNNLDNAVNELYLALRIDPNFIQALSTLQRIYDFVKQPAKAQAMGLLINKASRGEKITAEEIDGIVLQK